MDTKDAGRMGGTKSFKNMTPEQIINRARKGGANSRKNMTPEQASELAKKARSASSGRGKKKTTT